MFLSGIGKYFINMDLFPRTIAVSLDKSARSICFRGLTEGFRYQYCFLVPHRLKKHINTINKRGNKEL